MIFSMKNMRSLFLSLLVAIGLTGIASAQTWTSVPNPFSQTFGTSAPILMLDGTVLIHDADATDWWKLTPDSKGNYVNGTWTQIASLPTGYGPQYFASAVLPDGKLIIMGGEYNETQNPVWTSLGAIYDPIANSWTPVNPPNDPKSPSEWTGIGDSESIVLADGTFMLADGTGYEDALFDESTLSWSIITNPTGAINYNNEQGWTLLPDGSVFAVSVWDPQNSLRFLPSQQSWIQAGEMPQNIIDTTDEELGPQLLGYNGTVYAAGGNGNNAIYTPPTTLTGLGSWIAAPPFPNDPNANPAGPYDMADAPGCVLPNGLIMLFASPGYGAPGAQFFTWDGTNLTAVAGTPNTPQDGSYYGNMLILPSGQMLFTDFSNDIEIYTPSGAPLDAWRPTITSVPGTVSIGQTFPITGTQFNGLTGGSAYGDDFQNATNYPIVRITNLATGNVVYCRTGHHSTMAVATGSLPVSTQVTVPSTLDSGPSSIEVVANGIPSQKSVIHVNGVTQYSLASVSCTPNSIAGGSTAAGSVNFYDTALLAGNVTLKCSSPVVTIPTALTLAPGKTSIPFNAVTTSVTSQTTATITATCNGITVTGTLSVSPAAVKTLILTSPNVVCGTQESAIVNMEGDAPTAGLVVALSSNNPGVAPVPKSVLVPGGANKVDFNFTTNGVAASTPVTITASTSFGKVYGSFTVVPAVLQAVLAPKNLLQDESSVSLQAELNGVAPPGTGAVVTLSSSVGYLLKVPATVTIPAGESSATFTAISGATSKPTAVKITASYKGVSQSVTVTVTPAAVPASLTFSSPTVPSGVSDTGTLKLQGPAQAGGATFTLQSNIPSIVQPPSSITVIAGASSQTFTVASTPLAAACTVTITATGTGGKLYGSFVVQPAALASITASPSTVESGINTDGTVTLTGTAPLSGAVVTLKSNNPAVIVPASVIVPGTIKSTMFGIQTTVVSAKTTAVVTATYQGVSQSVTITLTP